MKKFVFIFIVFFTLLSCTENGIEQEAEKINAEIESIQNTETTTEESSEDLKTNQEDTMSKRELQNGNKVAIITTNKGKIQIFLETEKAPITTNNFIGLAKDGYYDGIIFHRIIKDFMIQGGDPDGTGMGGTSIYGEKFIDEIDADLKNNKYTISMANAGPNTNGSQFFINVNNNNFLDGKHAVFGEVIEGMDNVMTISKVKTEAQDKPTNEVKMISVDIKEYQDGKLVDFDFDKQAAIASYETLQAEQAAREEEKKQEELAAKKDKVIAEGDIVMVEMVVERKDEEAITTTERVQVKKDAEIMKGLHDALVGMKIGDEKHLELAPALAQWEYDEKNKQEVPRANLEQYMQGQEIIEGAFTPFGKVLSFTDTTVVLDTNLPFAGQTMVFDIKVVDIEL